MQQRSIKLNGVSTHFRIKGNGPALILLHASPSSSKMFIPFIEKLARHFTVIAPDTPGYGFSNRLSQKPKDLGDYVLHFHALFQALDLSKFAIYGTATGAQLGIRYALEYPEQVAHLFLDNAAHFTESQRSKIVTSYFPDLTPQADGSHLIKTWKMVNGLFQYFPWCFQEPEYKIQMPMPPINILHFVLIDFLIAGGAYDWAYRAAFQHERAVHVQQLKIPTTIFNWSHSILKRYILQLLEFPFPDTIDTVEISQNGDDRLTAMSHIIQHKYSSINEGNIKLTNTELFQIPAKEKLSIPNIEINASGDHLLKAWKHIQDHGQSLLETQKMFIQWLQSI